VVAEANELSLKISPAPGRTSFHPVFEFEHSPKTVSQVTFDGAPLGETEYAWDGKVLWLNRVVDKPGTMHVVFTGEKSN
jgi:hypothetical protein